MGENQKIKKACTLDQKTQYQQSILSECMLVFNINLSKNLIEDEIYAHINGKQEPVIAALGGQCPYDYELFIKKCGEFYVTRQTRFTYERNLDREFLIECWERDQRDVSFEFCCKSGGEDILYMKQNIFLFQEHASGDIIAQTIVKDISSQKEKERRIHRYQTLFMNAVSDYTSFLQIDMETGKTVRLQIENNEVNWKEEGSWECAYQNMMAYIHLSDVKEVRSACSLKALKKMKIGQKKEVHYRSVALDKNGNSSYYTSIICMTEVDGHRFATIFSTDNTSAMENERKQKQMVEQALVRAEAASKAKTNFLNNVSHDIRTPMNAIIGFTKLATTHIDNQDKVKDYLSKIMASGNHLLSLINDILDMSRIESGKIHLNETECNLSEQMHDIRSIIQADIKEKNLDFYIDAVDVFDEDVFCDKLRLNQILLNLLGNALKFTNPGGRIDVRITEKPIDSKEIANYEFRVKDSGIGMSREFVKRIFEPFEREQTSTISKVQGTGLGMSITKNLVDMMGGTIQVFSEKGKGSEFIVTIPLKKVEKKKDPILVEELRGVRALVVDDDFHMCKSVTNTLIQFGMRAEWTMNGREAISLSKQAISQKDEYQAYIIDWIMPDINGVDVVRQIRKEVGEHIPIIILTAYDWVEIEQEAMEAGVTAFCQKPLFISDLRKCLMKVMNLVQMNSEEIKEEEKHFHGEKILLVEDNILNQEIAVEILENHGFLVEVAKNGAQAVDMVSQSKAGDIDTILMDIQMPVMDGYEATKAIRSLSNQALANIPIIAMTANVFEEDRKKARDVGMDGYLAKPIDIPVLLETLQASGALENHTIF